ncbi:DUF1622 domain-containing protein [Pontibacter fetidus]|uniref:DUF1622 domain-containing protein n=1 Tax=Pontibacter fetidus TaxID=2700082 RepID=A0A6B2GXV6_9BACT|nr:DUF1622 domain-containing protein [Pontibacter fetidus]NDK55685.1 DUF1622 domain-containing protein [Pontibacter fetidus]
MENIRIYIEPVARFMEATGVAIIALGIAGALFRFLVTVFQAKNQKTYRQLRHDLGKVILLGLEVLVAADIIATVVTEPTLEKVLTLGLIVLIRTLLSLSLQVELEGRFPWQAQKVTPQTDPTTASS